MAVVHARVRVHHPCPYCDLSVEFPATQLLLWCDNRRDVMLVSSPDDDERAAVLRRMRTSFSGRPLIIEDHEALVVLPVFEWTSPPSVTGLARRAGIWPLFPVSYYAGRETYRFLSPSRDRLDGLITRLRRLGDVELLAVSDRGGLPALRDLPDLGVHLAAGMTRRQARALIAGFDGGLLDVPAKGRWSLAARGEGLSRSTFGEHLRKGILQLVRNSYPALTIHSTTPPKPVRLPSLSPSRVPLGARPANATAPTPRRRTVQGPTRRPRARKGPNVRRGAPAARER